MRLPKFQLVQPGSLKEACSFLGEHRGQASLLAGGTALLVDLGQRLYQPQYVVSMKGIGGMDYIRRDEDGGIRIGALASVESLARSALLAQGYPALAQAAQSVSVPPLRHMGTVGGNLALDVRCIYYNQSELWRRARPLCLKLGGDVCHVVEGGRRCLAAYQGDLAPALMALGARVKLVRAGGERLLPLQDFFTGKGERPNVLEGDEVLAEVQVPPALPNSASAYVKLRVREAMDFPLVGAAVALAMDGHGAIASASVVLGAVAPAPLEVANTLAGKRVGDGPEALLDEVAQQAFDKARPVNNLAVDAGYRRKMAKVLVRRALARALAVANPV